LEHIKKMSESRLGKKQSIDHIQKRIAPHIGRKQSPEHVEKRRLIKLGKPLKEKICPQCDIIGAGGAMNQWHFDNCKMKDKYINTTTMATL
jgi:hypothetical protein